jgi:hypothetical protein
VRHHKKPWKRRADRAAADSVFEQALLGLSEPAEESRKHPREHRKTMQLCRQVQRALMLALGGECNDEMLRDVYVESVEPLGGAAHLLVRVVIPAPGSATALEVTTRLNERAVTLRALVTQSICRKRAPMLSFMAVPPGGHAGKGDDHETE